MARWPFSRQSHDPEYDRHMEFEDDADQNTRVFHPGALDKKMLVMPAWPQNGTDVWVLKTPMGLGYEKGLARVWNALDMDERCEVVKSMGGTFYEDPAQCPDLEL